jgi:hypothetical protein
MAVEWSKHFTARSENATHHQPRKISDNWLVSAASQVYHLAETFLNTKSTAAGYARKFSPHSNIMICWWWKRNEYENNSRTLLGIHRLTRIEMISFQLQLRWQWMRSREVRWKINQIKSFTFVCLSF